MNPSVTLSMMVTRNITFTRGAFYIIAQIVGGIIGGALIWSMSKDSGAVSTSSSDAMVVQSHARAGWLSYRYGSMTHSMTKAAPTDYQSRTVLTLCFNTLLYTSAPAEHTFKAVLA